MEIRDKIILPHLVETYHNGCEAVMNDSRLDYHDITNWMVQEVVSELDCSVPEAHTVVAETMIETGCWE